jgi:hypothetical protein
LISSSATEPLKNIAMKPYRIAAAIAIAILAASLAACVETTAVRPDGTVEKSTSPAPGTVEAGAWLAGKLITGDRHRFRGYDEMGRPLNDK